MTALDTLLSRTSTSQLIDPAPEGETLDRILQAGLRAPDHGRLRPWRFVLIRGAAREVLADVATVALKRREPEVATSFVERQRARIVGTPLIIAVGGTIRAGHKIPEVEQLLSVGAAAMNILNAVHAAGFGGIWLTGPNSYDPAVMQALGFGHLDRLLGFLFVGTPAEEPRVPAPPNPADHVFEWTGPTPQTSFQTPLPKDT